jgi:PhnB protein
MVQPIPEGYRSVTPYLCSPKAPEAIEFYKKAFGAEELMRMPAKDGRVMHAEIRIGDSIVMLSDSFPEFGGPKPAPEGVGPALHLYVRDADAAFERAVKAGCKAAMPVTEMFWGDRFGKVVDPFGQAWSIAQHVRDVSPQEMAEAAKKAFG